MTQLLLEERVRLEVGHDFHFPCSWSLFGKQARSSLVPVQLFGAGLVYLCWRD